MAKLVEGIVSGSEVLGSGKVENNRHCQRVECLHKVIAVVSIQIKEDCTELPIDELNLCG